MKKTVGTILGVGAALLGCFDRDARAEEEGAPSAVEERLHKLEDAIGLDIGGMIYSSYQYNFNEPENDANSLRSLDPEDNSFTFDLFQLHLHSNLPEGVSIAAKLDFGKTADRIASDWNGDGALDTSEETNSFETQEAFIAYAPEWAGGGSVKFGKFVTLLGAEVIEAPANPNFTRSFLFGYAIPFTHTGLLFTMPLAETVSLSAGVVNGWDNVVDNNDDKTFLGNLTITPTEIVTLYVNGVYGNEATDGDGDARGVFDFVASVDLDPISLSGNFDYGSEGDGSWLGFAGIVGLDLRSAAEMPFGVYLRGEVFDDQDGFRTGTEQQLYEITLTGKYFLTENLTFWVEFRHDGSDEDGFVDEGIAGIDDLGTPDPADDVDIFEVTDTQNTALFALSYVF